MKSALVEIYQMLQSDLQRINIVLEKVLESEKCYNSTAIARLKVRRSAKKLPVGVLEQPVQLTSILWYACAGTRNDQ